MAKIIIDVSNDCIGWVLRAYPGILAKLPAIETWETKKPTLAAVKNLSKEVKRPIAFFLSCPNIKPESVGGIDTLDTRTIKSEELDINYKVVVLSEELQKKRKSYIYIANSTGIDILPKFLTFGESQQRAVVDYIISTVYPSKERLSKLDQRGLYEFLVSKIEDLNVLVFKIPTKDKSLRGVALYHDILPIIGVASGDVLSGQIFTVIHEFAHILLKSTMIHNEDTARYKHSRIESLCNEIAGKVLLQDSFISDDPLITKLLSGEITLDNIADIASKYRISRDVVLIRLLRARILTEEQYTAFDEELTERRKNEPKEKTSGGGSDTHLYTTINQLGNKYCRAVYEGYANNIISKSDLHYYLGRKDKYCLRIMSKIASKVRG
jgi:Zn-dependent peptidase ImmA (M78 family)